MSKGQFIHYLKHVRRHYPKAVSILVRLRKSRCVIFEGGPGVDVRAALEWDPERECPRYESYQGVWHTHGEAALVAFENDLGRSYREEMGLGILLTSDDDTL